MKTKKNNKMEFQDYKVDCVNPQAFDRTVNEMGAMLQQNADGTYVKTPDGYYNMRVIGNSGYVLFAIKNQGYGKVIES